MHGQMLKNRKINIEKWSSQQKIAKKNLKKANAKPTKNHSRMNMDKNAKSNNPIFQKIKATGRPEEERSWKSKKDLRKQGDVRGKKEKKDSVHKSMYSGFKSATKKVT
jgi:hypothetical protein